MFYIALISLFTILLIGAWKLFNSIWVQPRKLEKYLRSQGLKGNRYRLLFGDVKEIYSLHKQAHSTTLSPYDDTLSRMMPFMAKTVRTYGKNSFAWIGPKPSIIITQPDLMKVVLNDYRTYPRHIKGANKILRMVLEAFVYYEGDEWNKTRGKLNPAFHVEQLKMKIPGIQECAENILNQWEKQIREDGSSVIDVFHLLQDYTASVVTETLFSTPFNDEKRRTFHNIKSIPITDIAFNIPGFWYLPTERKRKAIELDKKIRNTFTSMINERLRMRMAGIKDDQWDLLDILLNKLYDGNMSNNRERTRIIEEAIAQFKLFYIAGSDTTSSLLLWTLVMLAAHQEWQARAREEVVQVFGNSKKLNSDGLNRLKIVSMIFNEVLRLYPPTTEIDRIVEEDTQLGGLRIPKGTFLQLPVALLHRDLEIWGKDALEFRPDRFAEGVLKAANGQAAALLPFSWGPRICIGQNFALVQAKIFLAQLLRKFSFELAPTYKHAPYVNISILPQYGAPLLLRKL